MDEDEMDYDFDPPYLDTYTPPVEWNAESPVGSPEEEEELFFDNDDYIDFDDENPDENYDECDDPDCVCHRR